MANRVNVEISANTSGYKNAIDEAKQANKQFQTSIEDIDIKGLNRGFASVKRDAKGLTLELVRLKKEGKVDTVQYRQLQRELIKAKKDAAELTDAVGDTANMIRMLSSDTLNLDTFKEGVTLFRDMASAAAALGIENEGLEAGLTKLAQIQTVANAAISISNALNKDGLIIGRIKMMQDAALAKAIDMEAAATGRATIAQKLFNAVAKANPYVLLASAILAVGGAIAAYIHFTKDATDADNARQKALQAVKDTQEQYNSTFTQSAASSITSYRKLQAEWKALKSAHEKNQWIKNNKSEFDKLGLSITDTASAENVFVSNSSSVVEGLIKRARAAAAAAQAQQLYQKALEKSIETEALKAEYADKMAKARGTSDTQIKDQFGNTIGTVKGMTVEEQRSKLMDELMNKMVDLKLEQQELYAEGDKLIRQSVELSGIDTLSKSGGSSNGATNTKKDIEYAAYSLTALEAGLSDLQKKYKDGLLPNLSKEDYLKQVDELKTQIENKKIELGIELPKTEFDEIAEKIKTLKANQLRVETRLDPQQYQAELKRLENEEHELKIKAGIEVEPSAIEKLKTAIETKLKEYNIPIEFETEPSELDKLKRELEQYTYLQEHVKLSDEDLKIVKDKIKQLKDSIESEEVEIGIGTVSNKVIAQKEEEKTQLENRKNTIINENGGIPEPNTSAYAELLDIMKQIKQVDEEITALQDPQAAAIEKQNKLTQQRAQALQGIGSAISGLGSAMNSLAKDEQKGVKVAALIAQAIGSVLAGAGTAIAQSASMGPWAWLAFSVAAMTTAATTIAQIKDLSASTAGYARGGVISGNSFFGDNLLIRANSGERVLTAEQNKNFEKLTNNITQPRTNLSVSSVAVEGSDLLLVINNTLKENGQQTIG